MATKFSMEQQTLVTLGQRTTTESDDLGQLVRDFIAAAEPLEQSFNGPARTSFNNFKTRADSISTALNTALAGIVGSIAGQNIAFVTGAEDAAAQHDSTAGAQDYSSESVLARIGSQA